MGGVSPPRAAGVKSLRAALPSGDQSQRRWGGKAWEQAGSADAGPQGGHDLGDHGAVVGGDRQITLIQLTSGKAWPLPKKLAGDRAVSSAVRPGSTAVPIRCGR